MSDEMKLPEAVRVLCNALKHDSGVWQAWQANIAIAFQDEYFREHRDQGIHYISNVAATNFLNNLISLNEKKDSKHDADEVRRDLDLAIRYLKEGK